MIERRTASAEPSSYAALAGSLLRAAAGSDPSRFRSMSVRFTRPIPSGQRISVSLWVDGSAVRFRTTDEGGAAVIDHGVAEAV